MATEVISDLDWSTNCELCKDKKFYYKNNKAVDCKCSKK